MGHKQAVNPLSPKNIVSSGDVDSNFIKRQSSTKDTASAKTNEEKIPVSVPVSSSKDRQTSSTSKEVVKKRSPKRSPPKQIEIVSSGDPDPNFIKQTSTTTVT